MFDNDLHYKSGLSETVSLDVQYGLICNGYQTCACYDSQIGNIIVEPTNCHMAVTGRPHVKTWN